MLNETLFIKTLIFFKDYAQQKGTFFNVKVCAINQNIYEFPALFNYFNQQNISIILNEVVFPLHTALWNNTSLKLKEFIDYIEKNTPTFLPNDNNHNNLIVWNSFIKLLKKYYKDASIFESFVFKNKSLTDRIKEKVYKKISPVFANQNELDSFFSTVTKFAYCEDDLKTLYYFFLIAPFDRMIGEIEIRNEQEVKSIVENVIKYFVWK